MSWKKQKKYYSEKKKKHTIKSQIILKKEVSDDITQAIEKNMILAYLKNQKSLFKDTQITGDSGYKGLQEIHSNVLITWIVKLNGTPS